MKWYIGQRIVAIRTHSQKAYKYGEEYIIRGLSQPSCGCDHILIDIGKNTNSTHCICRCGYPERSNGTWLLHDGGFAPLDVDISELTELLEEKITA